MSHYIEKRICELEKCVTALEEVVAYLKSRDDEARAAEQGFVDILDARGAGWRHG